MEMNINLNEQLILELSDLRQNTIWKCQESDPDSKNLIDYNDVTDKFEPWHLGELAWALGDKVGRDITVASYQMQLDKHPR